MAWTKALHRYGLDDRERDASRILAAFEDLMAECRQWPCPRDLIDQLPAATRPVFRALPKPEITPEIAAQRAAYFRQKADEAGLGHLLRDEL